ncbi:hypothetical protein ACFE04_014293 [Oxalis oulophora]
MATDYTLSDQVDMNMIIDQHLGYPKAYAKLCRDRNASPYNVGPPFSFTCYALQPHKAMRAEELDQMFPFIDPKAKSTAKTKIYSSLLWKQLNHLGNAGFDPAVIRVDPYGNVIYYHADSSSPLAWSIDHWFPCSRGGLTQPSNLRIVQLQVCKKKRNNLEFLLPWWDLQLGISVNQFLSIFASPNSDFRHRGFSFLFAEGENEELNDSHTVESHRFPEHFIESKEKLGLAPAAIVVLRSRESHGPSSSNYNKPIQTQTPTIAARKVKPNADAEDEDINFVTNPYQAIVAARNSLKRKEDTQKILGEIQKQDEELNELTKINDDEKLSIQDLELELIKRKRRVEKSRRLAESQSSYRIMLEKMIRDAMHQSVVYKEQVRLNQAASNALMARLEAQKAICDSAEKELHIKFKQRDELENQIRPEWDQTRKRSRLDDTFIDDTQEKDRKSVLYLPRCKPITSLNKEFQVLLEEEQRIPEAGLSVNNDQMYNEIQEIEEAAKFLEIEKYADFAMQKEVPIEQKLQGLEIEEGDKIKLQFRDSVDPEREDDQVSRRQRGKGNVEKWLQMLLDNNDTRGQMNENEAAKTEEIIAQIDLLYPQIEAKKSNCPHSGDNKSPMEVHKQKQENNGNTENKTEKKESHILAEKTNLSEKNTPSNGVGRSKSVERRKLEKPENTRTFRRIPSSPSLISGMRKGLDRNENENHPIANRFMSPFRTIRKAVKL